MATVRYTLGGNYDPANSDHATDGGSAIPDLNTRGYVSLDGFGSSMLYYNNVDEFYTASSSLTTSNGGLALTHNNAGYYFDFSDMNIAVLEGGRFGDVIRGTSNADIIAGHEGDDILEGGPGSDELDGGAGIDTLSYEHSANFVSVSLTTGRGGGYGDADFDRIEDIENLIGSAQADSLTGDGNPNILTGGAGGDTLNGGGGIDTASYATSMQGVTVDLTETGVQSGGDAAGDILTGITNVIGSTEADALTGNGLANTLTGGAGDDTLDGGTSADRLVGGLGDDTFVIDNVGDLLYEGAGTGSGTDTVESSVSYKLRANIENLTLTGEDNLNGTGNASENEIVGNEGNNKLDGGAGADRLGGGLGNDTYTIDQAGDVVVEDEGGGNDTIASSISFSLTDVANIEKLVLTGTAAIDATGTKGNDVLVGNAGNNVLAGGLGNDKLTGGGGSDTFFFNTELGRTNIDKITDFDVDWDQILLDKDIFANVTTDGSGRLAADEFVDIGAGNTVDRDDSIAYNSTTGALFCVSQGSDGPVLQQFALLSPQLALTAANFGVPFSE